MVPCPKATVTGALLMFSFSCQAGTHAAAKDRETLAALGCEMGQAYARQDLDTLAKLSADDYLQTDTRGVVVQRAQYLDYVKERTAEFVKPGAPALSIQCGSIDVRLYGNAAVVTGEWTYLVQRADGPSSRSSRWTSMWTRTATGWVRHAFQNTWIDPDANRVPPGLPAPGAPCAPARATPSSGVVDQADTVIAHVTVIDMRTGRELRDRTVSIIGNHIAAVRPSRAADSRSAARYMDGQGKFLIPGLWDMHVHGNNDPWYADWFPLYIANGVVGVREMFGPDDANRFRADLAARHIDAPHIYMGSPIVDGDPPDWPRSAVVRTPEEARAIVDQQKANGADFIKIYNHLGRAEYFALLDEAKRAGIPVAGHVPLALTAWEASAAGQASQEHLYGLATACSAKEGDLQRRRASAGSRSERHAVTDEAIRSYDAGRCASLYAVFRRNGTWIVPTLAVFNADFVAHDDRAHADPRLKYFMGDGLKWLRGDEYVYAQLEDPQQLAYAKENWAFMLKRVGELSRAHVRLLAGTDTGNAYTFPGFSLHEELALMVSAGVTPLGALQSATRNPALFMGTTDLYGAVQAGRVADLVLLDADPLVDIHNTTAIRVVVLGGKVFDRSELDGLLSGAESRAAMSTGQ